MDQPLANWAQGLATTLPDVRLGAPQQSGPLSIFPVHGAEAPGNYAPPLSGLKLGGVKTGYGKMELANTSKTGTAIVPLHIGFIQDGAQNHAMCRCAFLGAGQQVLFEDACCVQQTQGGFLEGREQWFFVLPLSLREPALLLRRQVNYGKLWPQITALNARFGLPASGHLELILSRQRAYLNQYQSRFELLPGQIGAIFFLDGRLAGIELAPGAAYFREAWMPLVCFCYGAAAMELERSDPRFTAGAAPSPERFSASNLPELRQCLADTRWDRQQALRSTLAASAEPMQKLEEERFLAMRLRTVLGRNFVGQIAEENGRLVYASVFARAAAFDRPRALK